MSLRTALYLEQMHRWPRAGRHILAHYDERSIIVYQASRPAVGQFAITHQQFGDGFSYSRMSWIKPNFLWMMYRSGWGSKPGQEVTLALRLRRPFFDAILEQAVQSTYDDQQYPTVADWKSELQTSRVRLQWDPDHDPNGASQERRAVQLGLRGDVLKAYGTQELLEVIDMTAFVAEQREHAARPGFSELRVPVERVYLPASRALVERLQLGTDVV